MMDIVAHANGATVKPSTPEHAEARHGIPNSANLTNNSRVIAPESRTLFRALEFTLSIFFYSLSALDRSKLTQFMSRYHVLWGNKPNGALFGFS